MVVVSSSRSQSQDDEDVADHHLHRPQHPTANDLSALSQVLPFFRQHKPTASMVRKMITLIGPTILGNLLWFLQQAIVQSFLGRRSGDEALAQFTIGISIFNVVGLSLGIGLASALDTLASQAYGRCKENRELGELLQRSLLVDIVLSIPLVIVFQHMEGVLTFMYDEELAVGAAAVLRASWLYLPLNIINNSIVKVLQAQNLPQLQLYGSCVAAVVCWVGSHFFITSSMTEAVWVLTMTHVALLVTLVVLSWRHPDCALRFADWPISKALWDWEAMKIYLSVGVPSLASLCAEWWAFELLFLFAARVSDLEVTILSVCLSVTSMCFSVALGVSVAGSVCIGNALGENDPDQAKSFAVLTFVVDQAFTCFSCCGIVLFRHFIVRIYSNDETVTSTFANMAILTALFHWGDSTQFTFQGIFRGAGKQDRAARAVLLSLWLVGLPLCWYFGVFHHFGSAGIFFGLICGFSMEVPLMIQDVLTWDWNAMSELAATSIEERSHHHIGLETVSHGVSVDGNNSAGGAATLVVDAQNQVAATELTRLIGSRVQSTK